jgi:gas vesicle protein
MMQSRNVPYVIAGSAIGGAIGYLMFTQSGRKATKSLGQVFSTTAKESVDELAWTIEKLGSDLSLHLQDVEDKIRESIEEGRSAYEYAEAEFCTQLVEIELWNRKVATGTRQMVDDLIEGAYTIEKSVLIPFFQARSLIRAFRHGWRVLSHRDDRSERSAA